MSAIDAMRILLPLVALLSIGGLGAIALVVTPWARIEQPAGLDDWRRS